MIPAILLGASLALPPQSPQVEAPPPRRPRIGLVLSGGGARGAAHIGVLRFLEEQHIPVDFVTGTSMGAIVGGMYCAGLSPDEIEKVVAQTDWATLFNDDPPREQMSWRRKIDDRSLLVDLEIGATSSGLELPSGVIQGAKISPLFRTLTLRELAHQDFDQLRLPYRAVAMDVVTGETVVLDHGDLAQAMRASMSIAGAFAPVEIDGRLLVDGGYVDNLPVDVAEKLGADIVIAVDVGTPPSGERSELRSLFAISSQVTDVIVAVSRRASRALLDPEDVLIVPDLGDISFIDFASARQAIAIGHEAAAAQIEALSRFSVGEDAWNEFLARQRAPAWQPPKLRSVSFDNRSSLSTQNLEAMIRVRPGDVLDPELVRFDLERLYGLGIFELVDFRVTHAEDGADLVYVVREKAWGPNYLRFGLALHEDFSGRSAYELGFGITVAPVNDLGAEWRTEIHIGSRLGIATEFYQPIDHAMRWFVAPRAWLGRYYLSLDRGAASDLEYSIDETGLGFDFGRVLGNWGEVRVGIDRRKGDIDAQSELPQPEEGSFDDTGYLASFRWDTLNDRDFPEEGFTGGMFGFLTREDLGADQDTDRALFTCDGYHTWGSFTATLGLELGTSFDSDLPLEQKFLLGGFGRLSGLAFDSLAGDDLALVRVGGYTKLGGQFVPTYAGVSFELGNVWDNDEAVSTLEPSAALYFGADTPVGPFILGGGFSDEGQSSFFLLLGRRP